MEALGDTYMHDTGRYLNAPQAVSRGMNVLKELLDRDPFAIHDIDDCDATALHVACLMGQPDAVELLIDWSAPLENRDCRGRTPLMEA